MDYLVIGSFILDKKKMKTLEMAAAGSNQTMLD